jgi:hypothetical protein
MNAIHTNHHLLTGLNVSLLFEAHSDPSAPCSSAQATLNMASALGRRHIELAHG